MRRFGILLIFAGLVLIGLFGYNYVEMDQAKKDSLTDAEGKIAAGQARLQQLEKEQPRRGELQLSVNNMQQSDGEKQGDNNEGKSNASGPKKSSNSQSNVKENLQVEKESEFQDKNQDDNSKANTQTPKESIDFQAEYNEAIATLDIPKLDKTLPVIEGTDPYSLAKGVGHLSESVFPGDGEQIMLSGHRDTVFRNFGQLEIGDRFIVNMPYGSYPYIIKETEIVLEDDTSIIRKMNEEVLVVTTCYPFSYFGPAPKRFIIYAYPE